MSQLKLKEDQESLNFQAYNHPQPGDYWHEMFCPYFLVVNVQGNKITVLNCLPDQGPVSKEDLPGGWTFDVTKSMVVDSDWIRNLVRYTTIDGFVADVFRAGDKQLAVVDLWRRYRAKQLIEELKSLGPELSKQLLLEEW